MSRDVSAFQLDTSGRVVTDLSEAFETYYEWSDLTPFAQGYVEALLQGLNAQLGGTVHGGPTGVEFGFSDLAPETLARVIEDCANGSRLYATTRWAEKPAQGWGRILWQDRRSGDLPHFRPLTPYLGDDGKVYTREAAQ